MVEQRRLERGHRQAAAALPALALPIPLPGDFAGQHPIGPLGAIAERVGGIGVERRPERRRHRLQQRVAGVLVGRSRPHDRAVIEADRLALGTSDLARENMVRDAPPVAADDVRGKPDERGDPGDKRVTGRRLTLEAGEADKVIRERKALDRREIAAGVIPAYAAPLATAL